jgi:hypothetical protein
MFRTLLNRVTPAHSSGAALAGSRSVGIRTAASARRVQYSASISDQSRNFQTCKEKKRRGKERREKERKGEGPCNLHPPSREMPLICSFEHIWKLPRLHCLQVPSWPPCLSLDMSLEDIESTRTRTMLTILHQHDRPPSTSRHRPQA